MLMGKQEKSRKKQNTESLNEAARDQHLTKPINKESNQEERNKGRPAKNNSNQRMLAQQSSEEEKDSEELSKGLELIDNKPDIIAIQALLDLFREIGEEKGLVMTENERRQLKAKEHKNSPHRIDWTPRH